MSDRDPDDDVIRPPSSKDVDDEGHDEPDVVPPQEDPADRWHPVVEDPADSFWANVDR